MDAITDNELKNIELLARNNEFFDIEYGYNITTIKDKKFNRMYEIRHNQIKNIKYISPSLITITFIAKNHMTIGLRTGYLYISL